MYKRCLQCKSNQIYFLKQWTDDETQDLWYVWQCSKCKFKIVENSEDDHLI